MVTIKKKKKLFLKLLFLFEFEFILFSLNFDTVILDMKLEK